ncbi:MAG: tetratricopeptide repeat protein [Rhodocyclaceae bacterium]|nr:tetratricopeptide repeat protein [Rhodocyclaceae bacterium]
MDISTHLKACQKAIREGRLADAEGHARAALAANPRSPSALNLIGVLHRRAGRMAAAESAMQQALALAPDNAALHRNLGLVELSRGKVDSALGHLRKSVALQPDAVEGHLGLARACARTGFLEDALRHFSQARTLAPDNAEIPLRMGRLLLRAGQLDAAMESFEASRALAESPAALTGQAEIALARGKPGDAEAFCESALQLDADHHDARIVLACSQFETGRPEEARRTCEEVLDREPAQVAALAQLARVQRALDDWQAAEVTYRCARALSPRDARLIEGHAQTLLVLGRHREGWDTLDLCPPRADAPEVPRWNGEHLDGKALLVHAANARDAIQFCRYASALQRHGARVIVRGPATVLEIVATAEGVAGVEREGRPGRIHADFHCPATALPRLPERESDGIPDQTPYLRVPDKAPPSFIGGFNTINVGIAWRDRPGDAARDLPLALVEPAMRMHGVRFHALQRPANAEEQALLTQCQVSVVADADSNLAATAASLASLDLVICADSVVAHLAAALGRPVWLLSHFDIDWRWQTRNGTSPWYPTLRVFRQRSYGDWMAVTGQLVIELARLVGGELTLPQPVDGSEARSNADFPALPAQMRLDRSLRSAVGQTRFGALEYPLDAAIASQSIAAYGEHCRGRIDLLEQILHRGDQVLFGGAGFGALAIGVANRVGAAGGVWAWEADDGERALLERNRSRSTLAHLRITAGPPAPQPSGEWPVQPRLLVLDLARVDEATRQQMADLVAACQPLIYLLNASGASPWLASLGYRTMSYRPALFDPRNPAGVARNLFGDARATDLFGCLPAAAEAIDLAARDLIAQSS